MFPATEADFVSLICLHKHAGDVAQSKEALEEVSGGSFALVEDENYDVRLPSGLIV
jgi:hypothetical protein